MYRQNVFHRSNCTGKVCIAGVATGYANGVQSIAEMPFVGGDAALDFVNTAEERGHPAAGDALVTAADLRLWGQRYGLLGASARLGADAGQELERARGARELLYEIFTARVHGRPATQAQLASLADLARAASEAGSLRLAPDGAVRWGWSRSELATVRHVAVTSGVELLRAQPSPRLRQCPGDHCGWIFLDATKRGNRRWCSMGECGQEAKDERRRARRRALADPEGGAAGPIREPAPGDRR
jgi:predicted RNA-binding Zn ribbon-like protein